MGLSFEEWSVCTFRDLDLHTEQWKRRQDIEGSRFRGLAAFLMAPYMEESSRVTLDEALPRLSVAEDDEDQEDQENSAAVALDAMWVDLKTRSKLGLRTALA